MYHNVQLMLVHDPPNPSPRDVLALSLARKIASARRLLVLQDKPDHKPVLVGLNRLIECAGDIYGCDGWRRAVLQGDTLLEGDDVETLLVSACIDADELEDLLPEDSIQPLAAPTVTGMLWSLTWKFQRIQRST